MWLSMSGPNWKRKMEKCDIKFENSGTVRHHKQSQWSTLKLRLCIANSVGKKYKKIDNMQLISSTGTTHRVMEAFTNCSQH